MTIRSPVPPAGSNWSEWHAARDAEVRAEECARIAQELTDMYLDPTGRELFYELRDYATKLRGEQ